MNFKISNKIDIDSYKIIRKLSNFGVREDSSIKRGLINSWYECLIEDNSKPIAMGRIIGDDGLTFSVTDVAVIKEYQGIGVAKMVVENLMNYYDNNAPKDAFMTLMAAGNAKYLYEKFGFVVSNKSTPMKYKRNR